MAWVACRIASRCAVRPAAISAASRAAITTGSRSARHASTYSATDASRVVSSAATHSGVPSSGTAVVAGSWSGSAARIHAIQVRGHRVEVPVDQPPRRHPLRHQVVQATSAIGAIGVVDARSCRCSSVPPLGPTATGLLRAGAGCR